MAVSKVIVINLSVQTKLHKVKVTSSFNYLKTKAKKMISGIDHINIVVKDLEKSINFYEKILGFKEDKRKKLSGKWIEELTGIKKIKAEVAFLSNKNTEANLELLKYYSPKGTVNKTNSIPNTHGIRHIAFKTDDFDLCLKKLGKNNIKLIGKPQNIPESNRKQKSKICYFLDPDGVILELTGFRKI